ncbi:MAG: HAMP domain-containing sensor histidine kinase [bacterium]|nr:HAMP domain-containing histidine kinase [Candidatus Margulisiibacteriota bacterium]
MSLLPYETVSHQLRTSLTILRGEIETTLVAEREKAEYQSVLKSNLEEIDWMILVVERLLLLGRLRSEGYCGENELFDFETLIQSIFERFKILLQQKKLDFIIKKNGLVQQLADPFLMRNLFMNLIDNAVKYSRSGTTITVLLKNEDDSLVVEISNFAKEVLSPTFEIEQTDRQVGLGLKIAAKIVEACLGQIRADVGQGNKLIVLVKLPQNH